MTDVKPLQSPKETDVFTALISFFTNLLGCEVIQGYDNGVPMPKGDFVCLTTVYRRRIGTNNRSYTDGCINAAFIVQPQMVCLQADIYSEQHAADWADTISTAWRDAYAHDRLSPVLSPLYCDDPKFHQFIDEGQRYVKRYIVQLFMQINTTLTIPIDFFDEIDSVALNNATLIPIPPTQNEVL